VKRTGTAVRTYGPWAVVDPGGNGRSRFVVVDTSVEPIRVYGPASRADCETWAHTSHLLLAATHGQLPSPLEERWSR
jgi:hypothetical protein